MKKVSRVQAGGFYVFEAHNCARNHLIEQKSEVEQFLRFVNGYLKDYMQILEYRISPTCWRLVVRIKSKSTVLKTYQLLQLRKGKSARFDEVWHIISERIRLFRSHFTKWVDKNRGREGNASKGVYKRFAFDSLEEAQQYIDEIRNYEMKPSQPNIKYQAKSEYFDRDGEIAKQKFLLTSAHYQTGKRLLEDGGLKCLKILNYINEMMENWINQTKKLHEYNAGKWMFV